jgi:hypothetical protein
VDVRSWIDGEVDCRPVVFQSEDFFRAVVEAGEQGGPVFEFGGRDCDPGFRCESGYILGSDYGVLPVEALVSRLGLEAEAERTELRPKR